MRRSITLLIAALSSMSLLGCEDGPNQTYSPAPPGAGDFLNGQNPGSGPVIDPATASLQQGFDSFSRQQICSASEKRTRWAKAISAEIQPPRKYGGIDMAGDDTWRGLTVEQ